MAKKRASGDGAVYQEGSGRWVAILELPRLPDGRRQRRKRKARTRAEAVVLLRQLKDEYAATGSVARANRRVGQAVDDFRDLRRAQGLSKGTLDQQEWQLQIILDGLARRRLDELTVADCDLFLSRVANGLGDRKPVSRQHVGRIRFVLINILANEMRTGHVARNVAELSVLPAETKARKERRALTRDELGRLLEAASGSRLVLIDLVGRNGLRPAEARAVRWSDLWLDGGSLTVSGQLDRENNRTSPKTKKSARTIRLDEATLIRINTWARTQEEMRRTARNAWVENDLVASTARGNPIDRHAFARSLKKLCARVDIEPAIGPYELRHTAITMQADAGHSSWEIADWAGTSEQMISEVYRHRLHRVSGLLPRAM